MAANDYRRGFKTSGVDKASVEILLYGHLLGEGCAGSAANLAKESTRVRAVQPCPETTSSLIRSEIRKALQAGNCQRAIQLIEEYRPGLLLVEPLLRYPIHLLQLIEYIRADNLDLAIEHAQNNVSAYALRSERAQNLTQDRLERTMALLAFKDPGESPFRDVIDQDNRSWIADETNNTLVSLLYGSGAGGIARCAGRAPSASAGHARHINGNTFLQLFKLSDWLEGALANKKINHFTLVDVEKAKFEPRQAR